MPLLSRESELSRLERLAARAAAGSGAIAIVEGPAGIGKTALLREAALRASRLGVRVLHAGGALLEREHAYGVARQLFVPALLDEADRRDLLADAAKLAGGPLGLVLDEPSVARDWGDPTAAAMHGLYWLTVRIAERGPVLLELDDAHWADEMSLRFILYLARRVDDIPVFVLLAAREEGDVDASRELLTQLRGDANTEIVRPAPLGEAAVVQMAHRAGLRHTDRRFVTACLGATGGNPFLLTALLDSLHASGEPSGAADVEAIAGAAPDRVSRWISTRLVGLGEDAERLAAAFSVLGAGATLGDAAALSRLDAATAARAADALCLANIAELEGDRYGFAHPLVEAAVRDGVPAALRAEAHGRAARLAAQRGAPLPRVAAHLLEAGPGSDPWALETLRAAARDAIDRGAPASAATYLTAALRESMPRPLRARVLLELGEAELHAGEADALGRMHAALTFSDDPEMRAQIWLALGRAQFARGEFEDARASFGRGMAEMDEGEGDLYLELRAWSMIDTDQTPELSPAAAAHVHSLLDGQGPGASRIERRLLAGTAYRSARTGEREAVQVAVLARRALANGELLRDSGVDMGPHAAACYALIAAGQPGEAAEELTRAISLSQRYGSWLAFAWFSYLRGVALYSRGALPAAEADLGSAAEAYAQADAEPLLDARAILALCRLERDDAHGAADACADAMMEGGNVPTTPSCCYAIARLRAEQGRLEDALEGFLACERAVREANAPNPAANLPWRADMALVAAKLGKDALARELIDENLRRARAFGAAGAIGIALRTAGILDADGDGIPQLREAVGLLEQTEHELQLARALVELGAALRRNGHRRTARPPLLRGLDLATRCGALALGRRARDEIIAAGARPRRERTTGTDALTASELRVARMAAAGMSNREIAQALFITRKTVAGHLTRVYQKLDIESRSQLAEVLDDAEPPRAT